MKSNKNGSKSKTASNVFNNSSESGNIFKSTASALGGELKQMGSDAFDTVMGKTPGTASNRQLGTMPQPTMEQRPSMMRPEFMGAPKKKERPRDINVFMFKERQETLHVEQNIKAIVNEIKKEIIAIEKQNRTLIAESRRLTVEQMPDKVGIYHVNFLEFILRTLRDIRLKATDAANWVGTARGKQKKMGYWGKAKAKGTSFTLSGERTAATQTG